ncbi:MAG: LlaJI family restriction endonuclease [Muribaculum sp.]|nr:LlaJI family restriction endonuclease [Muribaculum sp.]
MKLLIEDFPYPADKVKGLLGGDQPFETDGFCRIRNVGYYYNSSIKDCVFVLPKVILDYNENDKEETVFQEFHPTDIIDVDQSFRDERLTSEQRDFIYSLSTWIYRSIAEFARLNEELPEEQRSRIIYRKQFSSVSLNGQNTDATLIDIILSLIKFANENRDFFMFIIKNIHSGFNKIHWNKTIATKQAIVHKGVPHYFEVVNKKKQINFDEELLILFFSILRYVRDKYGFPVNISFNYELITGTKFEGLLQGFGKARLLQIKYKYFSDKALQLWNLCYCFFAMTEQMAAKPSESEYLFVSNYNIVFETMIDELISDKNIPSALRDQRDGKIVDHIYPYASLISPDNIYHIGDSKYYKIGGAVHGNSEYKQYTYARNVIHFNLDLWLRYGEGEARQRGALPYVDSMTDGYNVTPNFFISAEVDKDYDYTKDGVHLRKNHNGKNYAMTRHFNNRLFDRDTLWLSHYDINFLYVLALFVSPNQSQRDDFKEEMRHRFRHQIVELLKAKYFFYKFNSSDHAEMEAFVNVNFRELTGKLFHFNDTLLMALEKNDEKTTEYQDKFSGYFSSYEIS